MVQIQMITNIFVIPPDAGYETTLPVSELNFSLLVTLMKSREGEPICSVRRQCTLRDCCEIMWCGEVYCDKEARRRFVPFIFFSDKTNSYTMNHSRSFQPGISIASGQRDGSRLARVPFPICGPPHLITASEVATLDFVRNIMSIPAPKVLTWSSRADSTPVGVEFMILEKVSGVQLSYSLTGIKDVRDKVNDVVKVLSQMHDITKKFTELRYSMLGSLFYREDVAGYPHTTTIFADESEANDLTKKFAIGLHMSYYLWRDKRKEMDVDRGPCELSRSITLKQFLTPSCL